MIVLNSYDVKCHYCKLYSSTLFGCTVTLFYFQKEEKCRNIVEKINDVLQKTFYSRKPHSVPTLFQRESSPPDGKEVLC